MLVDWLVKTRAARLDEVARSVSAFYSEAEALVFTVQQWSRWDSYIVESFYETLRYFRHLIAVEQPDMAPFVTWARVPYLGPSRTLRSDAPYPLDPISAEHMTLDDQNIFGREW